MSIGTHQNCRAKRRRCNCTICLSEFEIDEEAKEMPCSHHFHLACIDKWLGINGSCSTCRYKMPMKEKRESKDEESSNDGDIEIEGDRVMFVFHVILRRYENFGPYITAIYVSNLEVYRHSNAVLIGDGDSDQFEAREGDQSEARDGEEFEVGGDISEARDMITDNN
ncbi:E3 ubiquitin-protein ligase [Capsicum chinense]|nr:E3 ubiquitin-protein ligase [Capsicum chinense]